VEAYNIEIKFVLQHPIRLKITSLIGALMRIKLGIRA